MERGISYGKVQHYMAATFVDGAEDLDRRINSQVGAGPGWFSTKRLVGTVADLIQTVFTTLSGIAEGEERAPVDLTPAVPVKKSVTQDHIVCLEDGEKLKMLKRHLTTSYGMTPERYRTKWGLEPTTPWSRRPTRESAVSWP